jgi:predicted amidophosphoribosyltransferase
MSIVIFFVLALLAAAAVAYPLLPGRAPARAASAVADRDIERAVRNLRRARARDGLFCPACGKGYQAGDRFCVRCGGDLPQAKAAAEGQSCPACGAPIRQGDQFCAKCGHDVASEEAA